MLSIKIFTLFFTKMYKKFISINKVIYFKIIQKINNYKKYIKDKI